MKGRFELKTVAASGLAAAGAAAGRSPGWALRFLSLALPSERPAVAPAAAKLFAVAGSRSKQPFSEGRPYCLGLVSGYLDLGNYSMVSPVGCLRFGKGYPCNPYGPGSFRLVRFQWNLKVLRPE